MRRSMCYFLHSACPAARLSEPHSLCAACWSAIFFIEEPLCAACGTPFDLDPGGETLCGPCHAKPRDFDKARSLLRYDDASKAMVLTFKHGNRLNQAPAFARWMERTGRALLSETDLIVPVPLHRWRLWRRRYNQVGIVAARLARASSTPYDPMILERKRPTPSQGKMPSAKARRRNVLGAFRVPPAKAAAVKGRAILLVDDVFTTGATLDACARALKRAGAARVDALTMARVVRPGFSDI
jgi:ComF family protein